MSICKLCLQEKKLIKAHLLPRNILKRIHGKNRAYIAAELHNLNKYSIKQDGLWDKNILCHDCDNTFSPVEQYVHQFITEGVNFPNEIHIRGDNEILIYNEIDEFKMRMFPLIVLWRMSISNTHEAKGVDLGPLEKDVYHCVKNMTPGPYDFFPFTIFSLKDLNDARATFIGGPIPIKIDSLKYYLVPISDFIIMVRAGKNVNTRITECSVKNNSIEMPNLKGKAGIDFLDAIFSSIPKFSR